MPYFPYLRGAIFPYLRVPTVRQNYGYMYEGNCICVILLLHVVHMSWCMGCMPYCCPLAISDITSELP